ncbi:MAG: hypothetical protein GWN39_15635, partial [Thermoplasmata archaeon]|nr:hypothetical protein [Thermoplasmata archaeon]NIS21367.1 hypothetical protein [Thermoplasmata archaeon]NIT78908.1 hypothetical protein [Thermoplasmata archaeon]NIU50417.1 hypothetical protein [Thermoplasmata archaeon]NIV80131.1 hypothetical protein [Thermoplasmata archaeon]
MEVLAVDVGMIVDVLGPRLFPVAVPMMVVVAVGVGVCDGLVAVFVVVA